MIVEFDRNPRPAGVRTLMGVSGFADDLVFSPTTMLLVAAAAVYWFVLRKN